VNLAFFVYTISLTSHSCRHCSELAIPCTWGTGRPFHRRFHLYAVHSLSLRRSRDTPHSDAHLGEDRDHSWAVGRNCHPSPHSIRGSLQHSDEGVDRVCSGKDPDYCIDVDEPEVGYIVTLAKPHETGLEPSYDNH
jgi:hypothetical protein